MEFSQQLFVPPFILIVDELGKVAPGLMDGKVTVGGWFDGLFVGLDGLGELGESYVVISLYNCRPIRLSIVQPLSSSVTGGYNSNSGGTR